MTEDRYTRITLRIPKDIHEALAAAADATSKSMNAEIIARLQASIESEEQTTSAIDDDAERILSSVRELKEEMQLLISVYKKRID